MPTSAQPQHHITIQVTPEEYAAIRRIVEKRKTTVSAIFRQAFGLPAVRARARRDLEKPSKKTPKRGLTLLLSSDTIEE